MYSIDEYTFILAPGPIPKLILEKVGQAARGSGCVHARIVRYQVEYFIYQVLYECCHILYQDVTRINIFYTVYTEIFTGRKFLPILPMHAAGEIFFCEFFAQEILTH